MIAVLIVLAAVAVIASGIALALLEQHKAEAERPARGYPGDEA